MNDMHEEQGVNDSWVSRHGPLNLLNLQSVVFSGFEQMRGPLVEVVTDSVHPRNGTESLQVAGFSEVSFRFVLCQHLLLLWRTKDFMFEPEVNCLGLGAYGFPSLATAADHGLTHKLTF